MIGVILIVLLVVLALLCAPQLRGALGGGLFDIFNTKKQEQKRALELANKLLEPEYAAKIKDAEILRLNLLKYADMQNMTNSQYQQMLGHISTAISRMEMMKYH